MVKISHDHIKDWWMPVPPVAEQRQIRRLAAKTRVTDAAQTAIVRAISLIERRRSALMSAAVARQINVGSAP